MVRTMVMLEWNDAFADTNGWLEPSDIDDEPCVTYSLGWLLPDAKKGHVSIAQSCNTEESVDSVLHVPVGMVVNLLILS